MSLKIVEELLLVKLVIEETVFDCDKLVGSHLRSNGGRLELGIFFGVGG
jgi:hypothetical protein